MGERLVADIVQRDRPLFEASYRSNKSAALTTLSRLLEAVFECREVISIEPHYHRAHHRLANLYLRLGEAEKDVHNFKQAGLEAYPAAIGKPRAILGHLKKCNNAKRLKDWHTVLRETVKVVAAGANSSPMVWNVASGFCFVTFPEHNNVVCPHFVANNHSLLSPSLDGSVRAWDLFRFRNFRTFTTPSSKQFISLTVDQDGEVICAGTLDSFDFFR